VTQVNDQPDAYPHLRAAAAARSQATVERLRVGITRLEESGVPVSGPSIYKVTGLAFKTIRRNAGAYGLYCEHAAYFRPRPKRAGRRRRQGHRPVEPQRDPLLNYSKVVLVKRLRAAIANLEQLQAAHAEQARRCQEEHHEVIAFLQAELIRSSATSSIVGGALAGSPQLGRG
jgi:hypothetical protein